MAVGLLGSASHGLAVTMTWTNGSDVWTSTTAWETNGPGAAGAFPGVDDSARFTNDSTYTVTVNITTNVGVITTATRAGLVTLDAGASTLTVTGRFRIAEASTTSTVLWAGGTLSVQNGNAALTEIASANSSSNSLGVLIVTNGTVIAERNVEIGGNAGNNSVGKLVISGSSILTNASGQTPAGNFLLRARSPGSELVISNGGKVFWNGSEVRAQSNTLVLVSDPGSFLYCTNIPTDTSVLTIGDVPGPGCRLIVSNGATVVSDGTISIGRNNGSSNTGIVTGAGSKLISSNPGGITIGVGSSAHQDNDLVVYDGGYVECNGAFFNIGGGGSGIFGTNGSFHMGGVGAMSTGFAISVRSNSAHTNALMVVTNAVFTCSVLGQQGLGGKLSVLSKGTLIFSNQYAVSAITTNVLNINGTLTLDGGTISAVSGTNALGVRIGVSSGVPGRLMTISNGGKLLSELGTIGAGSSFNTGIVNGVGSVWSNTASLTVGDSTGVNNTLAINGGAIFAGNVRVRSTNTIVFTAGTLSAGAMDIDPGANNSNVFVVGDGTSAAYYDMTAGGIGKHGFSNGGLVVTNAASLRGSGTLAGSITVLGTFVPGFANSVGSIFSSNSISFGSSTVLEYDLGTSSDSVTINSTVGLGNSTLNVTSSGGFVAGEYVLFQHTNTLTAPSGTITVSSLPPGFAATVSNDVPTARVLLVVTATGGGDPYGTWLTHYGLSGGNAAGTADPDGDGMNNTNEFLAGFNPTNNAAYLHIISATRTATTNITLTYLGANGDSAGSAGPKTNVLEFTTGNPPSGSYSNNFQSANQTNILTSGTGLGGLSSFVDTNGATGATRYYRVRVLVP